MGEPVTNAGHITAYWSQGDIWVMTASAMKAARASVAQKQKIPELQFNLWIAFAASELAGAYFGPSAVRRFQVVGKARERTKALPRAAFGRDFIVTDAETLDLLPPVDREGFSQIGPTAHALLI